jgi:hypothetical protein
MLSCYSSNVIVVSTGHVLILFLVTIVNLKTVLGLLEDEILRAAVISSWCHPSLVKLATLVAVVLDTFSWYLC